MSTPNNDNTVTMPTEDEEMKNDEDTSEDAAADTVDDKEIASCPDYDVKFYFADDSGSVKGSDIIMDELVDFTERTRWLTILVCWSDKMLEKYDQHLLGSPAEVYKPALFSKRPQESISLYKCLEAFLKEEPLGPEDMW